MFHTALRALLGAFTVLVLASTAPRAAHDIETAALPDGSRFELIVIEAEGCIYCQIFRRDVLPAYEISKRSQQVPLRFLDINEAEAGKMTLSEPVAIVPTVVLVERGREVSRVTGYVGPEAFFHSVNQMMSGVE